MDGYCLLRDVVRDGRFTKRALSESLGVTLACLDKWFNRGALPKRVSDRQILEAISLTQPAPRKPTIDERFWAKVYCTASCWLWMGASGVGYGRLSPDLYAHRLSWELHRGTIPDGMTIDHLCCNRLCVNPEHLEVVTQAVNSRRSVPARMAKIALRKRLAA